jgi:four helix bundle protein
MFGASTAGMPARHFKDLRCWQLADTLRHEVIEICAMPAVANRFSFCDSFLDAAGSVCHNLSEGFDRFESAEIARYFGYALASLAEVQDHLEECLSRKFIDRDRFDRLWDLAEHTKATARNFMRPHLERTRRKPRRKPPRRR